MAATFVTLPTPFLHKTSAFSFSNKRLPGLKRNYLKINAVAMKWEPPRLCLDLIEFLFVWRSYQILNMTIAEPSPSTIAKVCGSIQCVVVLITGHPVVIQPYLSKIDALVAVKAKVLLTFSLVAVDSLVSWQEHGSRQLTSSQ